MKSAPPCLLLPLLLVLAPPACRGAGIDVPAWGVGFQALWESYREETSTIVSSSNPASTRLRAWAETRCFARPARLEFLFPLGESGGEERWASGGLVVQRNDMDQSRRNLRFEVDPFPKAPQVWLGLLHEDVRQRRWAFDVPVSFDVAEEKVRSWWLEFGWRLPLGARRSDGSWDARRSRLRFSFGLPLAVETTNTALPGFLVEDVDGLRLRFAADLLRRKDRSLGVSWSYKRWNGSDWQAYGGGFARWPRNETRTLTVEASMRF